MAAPSTTGALRPALAGLPAFVYLGCLALAGLFAPLLANDAPIAARVGGRLVFPALAELPLAGRFLPAGAPATTAADGPEPRQVRVLLRAPIPYSFRGIRLHESLQPPGRRHLLGTDALGRDLLARLIHGSRPTLVIGLLATAAALLVGLALGAFAGLRGGIADACVVRLADTVACFPAFILALAFVAAVGHGGIGPLVAGIAINRWTATARYVRGEILKRRGGELWAAARAAGATGPRLVLRHLAPLLAAPLAVLGSFGAAHAIMLESSLSFLGFGVEPPTPSWGTMLAEARSTLDAAWWPVVFPALGLLLTLASLCALGERLAGTGSDAPREP
jgi:peptide/nickel transport system permease protein